MTNTRPKGRGPFALLVYATVAVLGGIVGFTASAGIVDSMAPRRGLTAVHQRPPP